MPDSKKASATKSAGFSLSQFVNSNSQVVLVLLLLIVSFFVFKDFIFQKKIYLFRDIGSDSINIYYPSLTMMADIIKADGVPGWSFTQGMGQNVFPLWLGEFFSNFLTYFEKSKIAPGIAYIEMLKLILAGVVFFRFLRELKLLPNVCVLFGLTYAFTGYMLIGGTWTVFSAEALYIALVLYGFERWLNQGKYLCFILGMTSLALLQPFLLVPYSFVLGCYIVARYFDTHERGGREFVWFFVKTIGLAALAVALSGYQLLPDLLQYLESPRVGGEASFFTKLQRQPVFGVADEWLRFTTIFRSFGADMLGNGSRFRGWQNYLEAPVFYCGVISLVLFPQFFISLDKRQKKVYGVVTFLIALPILFPYFRYMFWAFAGDYFRTYSLTVVLFMLIYAARALDYIQQNKKVNKTALGGTVLILLIFLFTPNAQLKPAINTDLRSVAAVLLVAYGVLVYRFGTAKDVSENFKVVLFVVCILELCCFSYRVVNDRDAMRGAQLTEKVGYNDYSLDGAEYLKRIDKGFFRVNKDFGSGMAIHSSINDAKVQGFYGTSSYSSFNQRNYIKFLGDFGVIDVADENSTRWAKGLVDRPVLFCLASGKYWLTKRTDDAIGQMGYEFMARFGDVKVYKGRFTLPFGFTYEKIIGEDDFKNLSSIEKDCAALRACVVSKGDEAEFTALKKVNLSDTVLPLTYGMFDARVKELKKDSLALTKFSDNHITGNISLNEPKVLFFSFPYDEGWKAKVNGGHSRLYRVNAGLTGLLLGKGSSAIDLTFTPRLKKEGTMLSVMAIVALAGFLIMGFLKCRKTREV